MYAMALMIHSLKNEIVRLTKVEKDDGEQAFRICEYARKFKERNKFDEAMELYQFVAQLFPKVAGVRCDMASEYFYKGKMNEALTWLDSCYNFKTVDETSFLNGAFIYSQLGYFDDAQNVLNTYSHIYNRKMDQFYYGLTLFSDSSAKYYEVLNEFCQTADSNAYANEDYIARKLLAFRDSFSLDQYKLLIADNNIPEYYKPLIYTRAVRQFADDCEPFLSYGIYESSIKNYPPAVQFLDEGENCQMDLTEKEYWMLHYAYALYMLGSAKKALLYFEPLTKSSNAFTQQAAKYFDAEILVAQKKNDAAKTLWQEIISSKVQTKYAVLAKQKLN